MTYSDDNDDMSCWLNEWVQSKPGHLGQGGQGRMPTSKRKGIPGKCSLLKDYFWANYNDLTATSLEIMISKGKYPQIALIQVSEIL